MPWLLLLILLLASSARAQVVIDAVPFTARTSSGSQDITGSLGGLTPKGILGFLGGGVSSGTIRTHARISMGAYDGTTQWVLASQCEDAAPSTDCDSFQDDDSFLTIQDIDRSEMCTIVASSFAANKVTLTQAAGCDQAYVGAIVFFAGASVSAKVGTDTFSGSIGGSKDITTVGFEPDFVIYGKTRQDNFTDAGRPSHIQNWGLGVNKATDLNFGISQGSENGESQSQVFARVQNDSLWELDVGPSNDGQHYVESYDSSGFSVRTEGQVNNTAFGYFAVKVGSAGAYGQIQNTVPTSGEIQNASPGFAPQFSLYFMSLLSATNTTTTTVSAATDDATMGVALYDGTTIWSTAISTQDGSGSAIAKSLFSSSDFRILNSAGSLGFQATPSHTGGGTDLNFLAAPPDSARKLVYLTVGSESTSARPRYQGAILP